MRASPFLRYGALILALALQSGPGADARTPERAAADAAYAADAASADAAHTAREADLVAERAARAIEAAAAAEQAATRLEAERRQLGAALAALGPQILSREAALQTARSELQALRLLVAEAQETAQKADGRVSSLIKAAFRTAREPTPSLLVHPDRPLMAARSAIVLRQISAQLQEAAVKARRERDRLAQARADAERVERRAREALSALRADEAEVLALQSRLSDAAALARGDARRANESALHLGARAQSLRDLVIDLERESASRRKAEARRRAAEAAEAARAATAAAAAAQDARTAEEKKAEQKAEQHAALAMAAPLPKPRPGARALTPRLTPRPPFDQAQGKLLRPAIGPLTPAYDRFRDTSLPLPRSKLVTAPYARVIAPWDGVVRFAGQLPKHGHIIILEPTDGVQIVLMGLASTDRLKGDRVFAGEPIGRMGGPPPTQSEFLLELTAAEQARPQELYVEIIRRGEKIDPTPWFAAAEATEMRKATR